MSGGAKAHYDGVEAFSETDFTEDLKAVEVPTLVMHGDDDQIVPIAGSAPLSAKLLRNSKLKIYERFPHGMRSEEHTSELQSLMRISYAVFCLKKKNTKTLHKHKKITQTLTRST